MIFALGNISSSNYLQMQKMPEDKINVANGEFNTHVGIDWLVALLAITGSILALAASNRIIYKLKQTDWRNEYK